MLEPYRMKRAGYVDGTLKVCKREIKTVMSGTLTWWYFCTNYSFGGRCIISVCIYSLLIKIAVIN
jgi:hypothetical protein